jgi:hypothetical protein
VRVKTAKDDSDISLSITFLETVDVRVKTDEDDTGISLFISFLETVDVRVKPGEDDSVISFSITFLGFSHAYEGVLSMASYIHLELERPFKLPCTYEFVSGDRNVLLACILVLEAIMKVKY